MKKNLWITIVLVFIGVCAISAGVTYLVIRSKTEAAAPLLPLHKVSAPPVLRIYSPHLGDELPLNGYVPIRASSTGQASIKALELWIDGKLFAARDDLATLDLKLVTGEWYWQPAIPGLHSLFVRSVDENGQTGYSEIVEINALESTGSLQLVFPESGQTLGDVAGKYNVDLPAAVSLNPTIDPTVPLEPEQKVFLPQDPDPVIPVDTSKLIAFQIPNIEKMGESGGVTPVPQGQSSGSLPNAPTLVKGGLQGNCDASLEFLDNSNSEKGFRIYRAAPNESAFTKIADLPPLVNKNLLYTDKALSIKGKWTYYAAAYNDFGETQSLPVTIEITDPSCLPPEPTQTGTSGSDLSGQFARLNGIGEITSDEKVDMAYVYLNINGVSRRLPDDTHTFLKGSGYTFDLTQYMLDSISTLPQAPQYNITVELWGWKGNKPELIQKYTKVITDFTMMYGCWVTSTDACDSDSSAWTTNVMILPIDTNSSQIQFTDIRTVKLRFKVITLNATSGYQVDLYDMPYGETNGYSDLDKHYYSDAPNKTVYPAIQPFYIDDALGEMFVRQNERQNYCTGDENCITNTIYQRYGDSQSFTLYYEVTPVGPSGNTYAGFATSNRVYVRYNQAPATKPQTPLTPTLPDIFKVEFLPATYTPATAADPGLWGCIRYLEDYPGHPKGSIECPGPIPEDPCSSQFSLSCAGNLLTETGKMIVDGYDWLAAKAGEAIGAVVNAIVKVIPGCDGSSACQWVVQKAVELTWTYLTGLPPNLPSSDELLNEGLTYIVDYAVDQEIGPLLSDTSFADALPPEAKDYINNHTDEFKQDLIAQVKAKYLEYHRGRAGAATESCLYPDIAKSKGKTPLCPNPDYAWEPYPGSDITTPTIQVKISRKNAADNTNYNTDASSVTPKDGFNYSLRVLSSTINSTRVDQIIPMRGGYVENYPANSCDAMQECYPGKNGESPYCGGGYAQNIMYPCWFKVTQPMQGSLYSDTELPIPWIEPGQSVTLTLSFNRNNYWYGGHDQYISEIGGSPDVWAAGVGDDWLYLYYFGQTTFTAESVCTSNTPDKVFCGSSDEYKPPIPTP